MPTGKEIRYNRGLGSFRFVATHQLSREIAAKTPYRAIITGNYSSQNFDSTLKENP
jgi:hypothetical protein